MSDSSQIARARLLETLGLASEPTQLAQALTHPSFANEQRELVLADNQRLEFLGDGVLDLCVSEILLERMPDADEGMLSRAYATLVSAESLATWARKHDLGAALRLGRGAIATGVGEQTNVLADAVEAIVAAVYLDAGLDAARGVATRIVADALSEAGEAISQRDPKSELQEWVQARGGTTPCYVVLEATGPGHSRQFRIGVEVRGEVIGEGIGRTKKLASQVAATAALCVLRREPAGATACAEADGVPTPNA